MIKCIVGDSMTQEFQSFLVQLKQSLDQNQKLNDYTKESLYLLVQEMYQKMNLPKKLLLERLKTVSFVQGSKMMDYDAYQYYMEQNEVRFQPDLVGDERNVICQALLEMAIIKEADKGMNDREFVAIKKGMLEIFANNLVQNESECAIAEDEQVIANLINVISDGKVLEAFVNDNGALLNKVLEIGNFGLKIANDYANYNCIFRKRGFQSQLASIEMILMKCFFNREDRIKVQEQIPEFEAYLVSNPKVMSHPEQYRGLKMVAENYQHLKDLQKVIPFPPMSEDSKTNVM